MGDGRMSDEDLLLGRTGFQTMRPDYRIWTWLALCCFVVGGLAAAQAPRPDKAKAASEEPASTDGKNKPALADVTRVSTEEAARNAAKEKSKRGDEKVEVEEERTSDSGVTEFRPARPDEASSAQDQNTPGGVKKPKGRALKNVHGTMHGASDSSGRDNRTGGAVGGSSSSGKTSIYVETERSRENSPRP
jgi:hypothetical protein